jgi:hypothetical protein
MYVVVLAKLKQIMFFYFCKKSEFGGRLSWFNFISLCCYVMPVSYLSTIMDFDSRLMGNDAMLVHAKEV